MVSIRFTQIRLVFIYFLIAGLLATYLPSSVSAQTPSTLYVGTGQSVSNSPNLASMSTEAVNKLVSSYTASGGTPSTAAVVIVMENVNQSGSTLQNAIRASFGQNVLILGIQNAWDDYTPYTLESIPPDAATRSISLMAIGGNAVSVSYATGIADFASNTSTEARKGGLNLATKLSPVTGKNNLILVMGQMHTPLNESVVLGMKDRFGSILPNNIKILGWSGAYWGGNIYDNGVLRTNQIIGIMISGNFRWAFKGINHGTAGWDGTSGSNRGDPIKAISDSYLAVKNELQVTPKAFFMVIGHPERNVFTQIRTAIANQIGNTPMIGQHGGSETGHDTTNGDVIAGLDHYFLGGIGIDSSQSTPNPSSTITPTSSPAITPTPSSPPISSKPGDANNDGKVDGQDYVVWLNNFGTTHSNGASRGDFNQDRKVDGLDYIVWLNNFGVGSTIPSPTSPPQAAGEWTQFAANAQRTSYSANSVSTPWRYKWQWNGAGSDGKRQSNHLSVPEMIQPITGGNRVYMVAANGVYAIDKNTGAVLWTRTGIGTLSGTPAYASESLFVPSQDGRIYKLNASNGITLNSFTGGAFTQAVLYANNTLYAGSTNGYLYSINPQNMALNWQYAANSAVTTPPAYSSAASLVVVNTQDLYVHAINATSGSQKWRVKPTVRSYQSGNPGGNGAQVENGWPVIAEQHGLVFVRYRLDWDTLWTWNPFPTSNAEIRANLQSQQNAQALFALSLTDGRTAFVPTVGNGGAGDGGYLPMGPLPIIKPVDNKEVAYIIWRNGLTCASSGWCDGREDGTMGEMVLDSTTVPGYQPGDVRFVRFADIQTDEMMNISMAGDIIFHSHWLVNAAARITDRSGSKGATFSNPITTVDAPFVIWRQCNGTNTCNYPSCTSNTYCGINCAFSSSRYCSQGLYSYGDARSYPPGFYEYNNDMNSGSIPFTTISSGLVLVKTEDGGLMALESGNPTASTQTGQVAGVSDTSITAIPFTNAKKHIGEVITATGTIKSVVDHRPKGVYLGFTDPHDGSLLIRVFEQNLSKFKYDLKELLGKRVEVSGLVTLYWPENIDPEIVVTEPSQIVVK